MKDEFRKVRKLITVIASDGLTAIFSCTDSGKIITRKKVDNPHNEYHPAIIIGRDAYCRLWVAHNHFSVKRPSFELLDDYLNGQKCYIDDRSRDFSKEKIVDRAIFEVLCGDTYHSVKYNGDTFVNNVAWQDFDIQKLMTRKRIEKLL
jgi:hypothetical protein